MFRITTKVKIIAAIVSFIIIPLLFSGCSNYTETKIIPTSSGICAYYSEDYTLAQTLNPQLLSDYMTGQHTDYHLFGWDISASLVTDTQDTLPFFISIEHVNQGCRAGVGFNNKTEGYKWNGFLSPEMVITNNPWSARLNSPDQAGSFVKIELSSGLMGSSNAVYRLTADVYDLKGKRIQVDVRLRDPFGAINQGYGTTSFYPQFITPEQRAGIMATPERTVGAYLAATGDPMVCQGDYYYALPLMNVEQFSITYDGKTMSGSNGKSWMDYFVQTYDARSYQATTGSTWNWIAVQLPGINTAINILKITTASGTLPYARLFNTDSERSRNGARKAAHSWAIDKITVEPVPGTEWVSKSTGQRFAMQYRIKLESDNYSGDLTVKMLTQNQEVVLPEGSEYQGLGIVDGILDGRVVHGRCWIEVQPVQP